MMLVLIDIAETLKYLLVGSEQLSMENSSEVSEYTVSNVRSSFQCLCYNR